MNLRRLILAVAAATAAGLALHASVPLQPLHARCIISASENADTFRIQIDDDTCSGRDHCGSSFSNDSFTRFTGITLHDLTREGASLTATLAAEAGTFTCAGTVHNGSLSGDAVFSPDMGFVERMQQMGFSDLDSKKLQAYAFIGVESAWARSLQQTGIQGLTTDNLIALHIFNADPSYIRSITALGYELPSADQLIGLKVQGVNAQEVGEIRALGFKPTLDELVQIRIFHITPDFIRRMRARGFNDLTIAKLVQIRIFKLAE
jgi:hypothetical protein